MVIDKETEEIVKAEEIRQIEKRDKKLRKKYKRIVDNMSDEEAKEFLLLRQKEEIIQKIPRESNKQIKERTKYNIRQKAIKKTISKYDKKDKKFYDKRVKELTKQAKGGILKKAYDHITKKTIDTAEIEEMALQELEARQNKFGRKLSIRAKSKARELIYRYTTPVIGGFASATVANAIVKAYFYNPIDKMVTRDMTIDEFRKEVTKQYILADHSGSLDLRSNIDFDNPDWYDQFVKALGEGNNYSLPIDDYQDLLIVNNILSGNHQFYNLFSVLKSPNNTSSVIDVVNATRGTADERFSMYTDVMSQKWGGDFGTFTKSDDLNKAIDILNTQGEEKFNLFMNDLATYKALTYENSQYPALLYGDDISIHFDGKYYDYSNPTYVGYLDNKLKLLKEQVASHYGDGQYNSDSDLVNALTQGVNNGDEFALNQWTDYMILNQAKYAMCGNDPLFMNTPIEALEKLGYTQGVYVDKYQDLGTPYNTIARILQERYPDANCYRPDGTADWYDYGTLSGVEKDNMTADINFYETLMTNRTDLDSLEYVNELINMSDAFTPLIEATNQVNEVIPADNYLTHVGIPVTGVFVITSYLLARRKFRKAVSKTIDMKIMDYFENKENDNIITEEKISSPIPEEVLQQIKERKEQKRRALGIISADDIINTTKEDVIKIEEKRKLDTDSLDLEDKEGFSELEENDAPLV